MKANEVREIRWVENDARYYAVERPDGEVAIVKRHGRLGNRITCMRCGVTEDVSFRCQDLEAVKNTQFLNYDD